jgi:hypothetical protein
MGSIEKNSVIVELYDLPLTERKNDRFGRVVTSKSLIEDDLVNIAVSRRTDLNASTLKASMEILKEIAIEQIANGASVRFGLGYFHLVANGVFFGDNARWDPELHCLVIKVSPTMELRVAIENCHVDVRGMAQIGVVVNTVIDVSSGSSRNGELHPTPLTEPYVIVSHHTALQVHVTISGYGFPSLIPLTWLAKST